MNLVIDIGNTLIKIGVFHFQELKLKKICSKSDFVREIYAITITYPEIENAIISSVGRLAEKDIKVLGEKYNVLHLDNKTKIPFINKYSTPNTLGVDRIALISAAAQQFPEQNVLVIDAGTCITYDFLNSENEYLGGAISPGMSLRYLGLHNFTDKLPLLTAELPDSVIGDSTNSSIHSGIINGILYEIDGFIENYKLKTLDLTVILTGGDTHFLRDSLKNDIFANSNFLLEGLNHILEYNIR